MKRFPIDTYFESFKKGCPDAFEVIYAHYHKRIYWMGRSLIKNPFVVETLVQDTFLKLWDQRDIIESPKHLVNFLYYVIARECRYFYVRPKNKFQRTVSSLERFENYQDYMGGYDPVLDAEHLKAQKMQQQDFDRVEKVLPFLKPERKYLIELCLKHGFRYKVIADLMGKSITYTSNEVKRAIQDIKTIVNRDSSFATQDSTFKIKAQGKLTEEQEKVLQLRREEHCSFAAIANQLNIPQKEVHRAFMSAYRLLQNKHQEQLQSA